MENLVFREISSDRDINLYLEKFENYVGVRLPEAYAKNSRIVGVFLHDILVGGYMLVSGPEFRSLMFIPDQIKASTSFFSNDPFDMLEVNGVWISSSVKTAKQQFQIWSRLIADIFLTRKTFLLLMCNAKNKNIAKLHNLTNPTTLYEGPPWLTVGSVSHDKIRVSYTSRWRLLAGAFHYWKEYRKRMHREETRKAKLGPLTPFKHPEAKAIKVTE